MTPHSLGWPPRTNQHTEALHTHTQKKWHAFPPTRRNTFTSAAASQEYQQHNPALRYPPGFAWATLYKPADHTHDHTPRLPQVAKGQPCRRCQRVRRRPAAVDRRRVVRLGEAWCSHLHARATNKTMIESTSAYKSPLKTQHTYFSKRASRSPRDQSKEPQQQGTEHTQHTSYKMERKKRDTERSSHLLILTASCTCVRQSRPCVQAM